MFSPGLNPSTTTTDFERQKLKANPPRKVLEEEVGAWAGVVLGPRELEGLIKTVVINSVHQWLMSVLETNLAHGLWTSVELRKCKRVWRTKIGQIGYD